MTHFLSTKIILLIMYQHTNNLKFINSTNLGFVMASQSVEMEAYSLIFELIDVSSTINLKLTPHLW